MNIGKRFPAIIFIVFVLALKFFPFVFSQENQSLRDIGPGEWLAFESFVNMTVDESSLDGNFSFKFSLENDSRYMNFGYVFDVRQNLSNAEMLVSDIMIRNVSIELPCSIVLHDTSGNRRGFWDLAQTFYLDSMKWARVVVDFSVFRWENDGFDLSNVASIRFVSYNNGTKYSQTIWVSNLSLFIDVDNDVSEAELDSHYWLAGGIFLFSVMSVLMGYLVLRGIGVRASGVNFPLMLPVYFVFGLAGLVLVLMPLALAHIDTFVVAAIFLFSFVACLALNKDEIGKNKFDIHCLRKVSVCLPLVLLGLSFGRFVYLAMDMGWAPILDPQTHGMYVGLVLHHHRIPTSTFPVGNLPLSLIEYPLGFHVLSTSISLATGLYPGLAILALATAIVAFLPSLLFSTVFFGTSSMKLSTLAYLLAYFLPTTVPLRWQVSNDLLFGTYLPGTYPNLLGNILFISFFAVMLAFDNGNSFKKVLVTYAILTLTLAIVYYPLLPFAILFMILRVLGRRVFQLGFSLSRLVEISATGIFLVTAWWLLLFKGGNFAAAINLDSSFLFEAYSRYPLFALSPYIVYTVSILVALIISVRFLFNVRLHKPSVMFLSLFFPLMLAQQKEIYTNFLWFIQPDRVLILLVFSSYIVILVAIAKTSIRKKRSSWLNKNVMAALLICSTSLFFGPSVIGNVTFSYPSDLKEGLPYGNDFAAMKWLSENVDAKALILNDFPLRTAWLPSFKAHNVVNDREILRKLYLFGAVNGTWLANRTIECNNIIIRFWDYELMKKTAEKFNLKYIYISEGNTTLGMYARGQRYSPTFPWKNVSQEQRIAFYLLNPCLEVAHRSGNSVVFKVVGLSRES